MATARKFPWSALTDGLRVNIRLTPKASRAQISGLIELPDGRLALKVHVNAPPEGGKANAALIQLLAKSWRLPKTSMTLTSGSTGRLKTVHIAGAGTQLAADLTPWLDKLTAARE